MGREEGESSSQHPRAPHFFKIILSHTLRDGTLEIPPSFVEKHGNSLSKNACLEVSSGAMWRVSLRRDEGRVWLHKGWRKFVEYYSIRKGYFLVFRFKGGSHFRVFIFDKTALEIEYSVSSISHTRKVEDEDEASVEILDEGWQKLHKRRKIKQEEEDSDNNNNVPFRAPDEKLKIRHSSHLIRKNTQGNVQVIKKGKGLNASSVRERVLQRAEAFKTRNPYFVATMKPSYVTSTGYLYVPESHAKDYFHKKGNNHIRLEGADGRTWSVKCTVQFGRFHHVRLYRGWSKFAQENHLQEGDVCVFELINSTAMTYRVTIFKQEVDDEVLRKGADFKSKNPHFIIQMCPTYISSKGLSVPNSHSSRYLKDTKEGKTGIILRGSNDRTWAVSYRVAKSCGRGTFGRGWRNFVSDNQLKVGDTCVFEMIRGEAKAYNVTILRAADHI